MWRIVEKERALHNEYVERSQKIHDKQVENINTAGVRAIDAIRKAENEFDSRNEKLDDEKKKMIEKIVKKHAANPDAAAKELADKLGFTYVP
jgi:fumarate hydratase class II